MKKDVFRKTKIIGFITDYLHKHGKCPSIREIGKGVGLKSISGVWQHLEEMGFTTGDRKFWKENKEVTAKKFCCPTCLRSFEDKNYQPIENFTGFYDNPMKLKRNN